jgi:DNA phosphorothioation-dependent restriction protein DptG
MLQAREAYETLIDPEKREQYERRHVDIQAQWQQYRRRLENWKRRSTVGSEAKADETTWTARFEELARSRRIGVVGARDRERRAARAREVDIHSTEVTSETPRCYCPDCI